MKRYWEFLGLGIAILVLALYIGLRKTDRIRYSLPAIESIGVETIDRITMESFDSSLTLVKRNGRWIIQPEGHAADPAASADMAQAIADLRITDLVSTSGDFSRYGLDETQRIGVSAYSGEERLRSFSVGKSSGRATFIRLGDEKRVFSAPTNLRSLFERDGDALRDKQVLSFAPETVNEIEVSGRTGTWILVKATVPDDEEGQIIVWKTDAGEERDAARMEETLRRLSDLRCVRYLDPDASYGTADWAIELKGTQIHRLSIYPAREDGYPAESSAVRDPFLLSRWIVEDLTEVLAGDAGSGE